MLIYLQRETEEKARQPETKLGAIAKTRHITRLRNAKRSRPKHPKPTHGARDRPKQGQPRAGRDRASGSGSGTRRDACARPTQGRVATAKGNAELPERPRDWHADIGFKRCFGKQDAKWSTGSKPSDPREGWDDANRSDVKIRCRNVQH
jgi:hypothetical protein